MKKTNHKRLLTLVLALVLVFALSLGAFAAWNQFQGSNDNNGVISVAPPTSTPTVTEIDLPRNGSPLEVYSGVDAETVINNGVAYTLYNGGIKNNNVGGARLHAATVSTGAQVWDIQLDNDADNESQLSTPYLDTVNGKLYTTVTIRTPIFDINSVATWTASGDASIDTTTGVATFGAGTGVISTSIDIDDDVNYLYLPSNLYSTGTSPSGSYTIRLMSGGTLYRTLSSGAVTTYGTYDNYNDIQIAHGTYTLEIEVINNTSDDVKMSQIVINRYDWRLYCVSNLSANSPTVTMLLGSSSLAPTQINTNYEGQITTPLYYDDGKLYFGVYGGTHSYYQYDLSTSTLVTFTPSVTPGSVGEDFYWAGAVKVNDGTQDYIVFGSDSGKVYVRSKTAFGTNGTETDLSTITPHGQPAVVPGEIRSSMVLYNGKVYFTSKGDGNNGWLWYIDTAAITHPGSPTVQVKKVMASKTSVSTPVISDNGILYIGTSDYDPFSYTSTGRIEAFAADLTSVNQYVYVGDPVQSSPIVYSSGNWDYVYFTTNAYAGAGYCYRLNRNTYASQSRWTAGGTSNNCFSVQGFSSEDGYLIYGDDDGRLYIMP